MSPSWLLWGGAHDDVIKWKHFRVTGPLCGEFTGQRWIPLTKATLGSYNFRAIFTHAWAGVTTLCSCKYFGNIDNPDPLMQYTNKKVITSIFCWSRILHEKISLYGEFMNYLKKCARHFLNLKTSFSWDDRIISTAKWVVPYKQETFVVFIPIRGKKIFSLIKSISFDIHGKVVKKGRKCDITLDLFPTKLQKNYPTRLSM